MYDQGLNIHPHSQNPDKHSLVPWPLTQQEKGSNSMSEEDKCIYIAFINQIQEKENISKHH